VAGSATEGGENMPEVERTDAEEARRKVKSGQALLVCAYDDEVKYAQVNLDGSISLASFRSRLSSLPKHQEIIFYCA